MDYDGDGDLDVLSGSYTGEVYWFERRSDGGFEQGRFLRKDDGTALGCGTSITPEAADMDGDGDLDLVIGSRSDGVCVFENSGTREKPVWTGNSRTLYTVDGKRIDGSNAHLADWDGDGVRDLVLGSEFGSVVWHRNVGTETEPRFGAAESLVGRTTFTDIAVGQLPATPGWRTKVHVTDWNGDGRPDLLVGDVQWLKKTLPPLTAAQQQEKDALTPAYQAAKQTYESALDERNELKRRKEPVPAEFSARIKAARAKFTPLSHKMAEFERTRSESHGWVWLYLRRPAADRPAAPREKVSAPSSNGRG